MSDTIKREDAERVLAEELPNMTHPGYVREVLDAIRALPPAEEGYSICSAHQVRDPDCPLCQTVFSSEAGEVDAALAEFEARTRALPMGHEDKTKGASTYNWRMTCLQEIRDILSRRARAALNNTTEEEAG